MARALREAPEESPEVPEADLSMELQDQLKRRLTECQSMCMQEERELCDKRGRNAANFEELQEKHAEVAVSGMVRLLRSFDPDISKEKLSSDIHNILHADSVVGHLKSHFKEVLRKFVPRCREDWLGDDIERHLAARGAHSRKLRKKMGKALGIVRARVPMIICDPTVYAVVLSGSGGAVLVGTSAGLLGFAGGASAGAVIGLLPAPFTMGLSIPAAATLGGGVGACAGAASGACVGLLGGGITGGMAYTYRLEIRNGVVEVKQQGSTAAATAMETSGYLTSRAADTLASAQEQTGKALCSLANSARLAKMRSWDLARDPQVQTTVVSAASGAVAGGTGGGVMGLTAGSVVGAACGVLPAVFTFGLSIPIGAVVGGSTGLCLGATAGSATGLVGGWVAGHYAYTQSMRQKGS